MVNQLFAFNKFITQVEKQLVRYFFFNIEKVFHHKNQSRGYLILCHKNLFCGTFYVLFFLNTVPAIAAAYY